MHSHGLMVVCVRQSKKILCLSSTGQLIEFCHQKNVTDLASQLYASVILTKIRFFLDILSFRYSLRLIMLAFNLLRLYVANRLCI